MKKVISSLMAFAMCLSLASCDQKSKYTLSNIKLTDTERPWSCPDEQYAQLLEEYEGNICSGTMI